MGTAPPAEIRPVVANAKNHIQENTDNYWHHSDIQFLWVIILPRAKAPETEDEARKAVDCIPSLSWEGEGGGKRVYDAMRLMRRENLFGTVKRDLAQALGSPHSADLVL